MDSRIACSSCNTAYPENQLAYKCPKCGGTFHFSVFPGFDPAQVDPALPGIWRYRHSFGLPENTPAITLGEGGTPLVSGVTPFGPVAFKLEFLNPTGSHKDRGIALLAGLLAAHGIREAVEDSSGNAGASFAAYAARAGVRARVFVPDYASGPKRTQISAYGAEVVRVLGKRSDTAEAVRRAADAGAVYASHAYLPHLLPGFATLAYELVEQLGKAPGIVIAPAGQGSLLLGIGHGFKNLVCAGVIDSMPRLVGVQAMACAPIWAAYTMGPAGMQWVTEGQTAAEGVRVRYPLWGDPVLRMVAESRGAMFAVEEERIAPARNQLAASGFYVEPTSAIVWDALRQLSEADPTSFHSGPVVAVLTGSGLKSSI